MVVVVGAAPRGFGGGGEEVSVRQGLCCCSASFIWGGAGLRKGGNWGDCLEEGGSLGLAGI